MKKTDFLTAEDELEIIEAIKTAENKTSGEIRVHIESHCKTNLTKRSKQVFEELKMHRTALKNGVLIYLAIEDKKFYIMGDSGIDKVVPDNFWESTKTLMQENFKKAAYKKGLVEGILKAGEQLKEHFPVAEDDIDELPNEISRG